MILSKPNLLILFSDEHQAAALSCAGHPFVHTPNLDRLASMGTRFREAYTPSPICVPARASLATGLPVHKLGLWDNAMPYIGNPKGWGHQLQAAGIPCESIGKLHYRSSDDDNGFDQEHIPMMVKDGVGMVWASIRQAEVRWAPQSKMLGEYIGPGESPYTVYDSSVTKQTLDWLQNAPDEPWCLYVGLVAPHFPLVAPREFYDLYPEGSIPEPKQSTKTDYQQHPWVKLQNEYMNSEADFTDGAERTRAFSAYYGLVSWLDYNVGLILDKLESLEMLEDTVIIYSSDHGDNVGARGLWGKSVLYNEAVKVPLLIAGPNVPEGVSDTPVSLLDIAATVSVHFGQENIAEGDSLIDIIANPSNSRKAFSEYHAAGSVSAGYMWRSGPYKLHYYVNFEPELFDLDKDPEELVNVATNPDYQAVLSELIMELKNYIDPEGTDAKAHAAQEELVASLGGRLAVRSLGPQGATPPPKIS